MQKRPKVPDVIAEFEQHLADSVRDETLARVRETPLSYVTTFALSARWRTIPEDRFGRKRRTRKNAGAQVQAASSDASRTHGEVTGGQCE